MESLWNDKVVAPKVKNSGAMSPLAMFQWFSA
jgi:hypothetical protein